MLIERHLRHVLALAAHGHFGRAAAELRLTQPALSKSIQAFEAELGVQLFHRQRSGVALTAFGRLLVEQGAKLARAEDELLRELKLMAGLEIGTLSVGLGPYPSVISGYEAAGRLAAMYPRLRLQLHVAGWDDITRGIAEGRYDLGVADLCAAHRDPQFQTEALGSHWGHFFCRPGHPLLGRGSVSIEQLAAYPWIATRFPRESAAQLPAKLGAAGHLDPASGDFIPAVLIDVPMQLPELLAHGDALALCSPATLERELADGRIAIVPSRGVRSQRGYGFIHLKGRSLGPAGMAFMAQLRAVETMQLEREARIARSYLTAAVVAGKAKGALPAGRRRPGRIPSTVSAHAGSGADVD